jgi:hypothetical protein
MAVPDTNLLFSSRKPRQRPEVLHGECGAEVVDDLLEQCVSGCCENDVIYVE